MSQLISWIHTQRIRFWREFRSLLRTGCTTGAIQTIYTTITTVHSSGAASSLVSSTKDSAMVHMSSPAEAASETITTPSFKNHHEIPASRALPDLEEAHVIEGQESHSGCNSHLWRCRASKWSSSAVWISQKLQLASRLCCRDCCISSCRTCGTPECHRPPFEHRPCTEKEQLQKSLEQQQIGSSCCMTCLRAVACNSGNGPWDP